MQKKIARLGILTAQAIVLGAVEASVPLPIPVPGVKIGLANVMVLTALYMLGPKEAAGVSTLRVVVLASLFTGPSAMLYSLAGAALSFLAMCLLKKTGRFSAVGVSMAGGVFHNLGQIAVAATVVANARLFYYLPVLTAIGIVSGGVTGVAAAMALRHFSKL